METSSLTNWKHYNNPVFEYEADYMDYYSPWSGHKIFIYNLIRNLEPQNIIELGTHKGTSLFSMAQAIKDGKIKCRLSGVDTWEGDINTGGYNTETVLGAVKATLKKHYSKVDVNLMKMYFDEALEKTPDASMDIIHIDGLHTYDAVKHDFETWLPRLKKDGIILFHDTVVMKEDFGVIQYWAELTKQYPVNAEFLHSFGLGVIVIGDKYKDIPAIIEKYRASYLEYSYEKTKYEAYLGNEVRNELESIKQSSFWKLKERVKKIVRR